MTAKLLGLALGFLAAASQLPAGTDTMQLIDPEANRLAVNLYRNLAELGRNHVLFGHQGSLAYGYTWIREAGRSDVKDATGSYPAVYGWDIMDLLQAHGDDKVYGITGDDLVRWVREAHARGGVSTFSWHQTNPVTGGSFYDKTPAAATLLPGGDNHEAYRQTLDRVAAFFHELDPIPVIFRPYHEHNGDWFWWCKSFVSEEEFIQLWRFTVEYLRDEKEVHNLIYAFSPDRSRMDLDDAEASYFYAYPGDDYVDILGLDDYWDVGHEANKASPAEKAEQFRRSLELVVRLARERNKIAALTETGSDTLPEPDWYTRILLAGLDANAATRQIAYLQVWRNANREAEGHDHFYVPPTGHPAVADFRKFKDADLVLFEDELPPLFSDREVVDKAAKAMLAMQRRAWEQGVAAQALHEWGCPERVLLLARDAVVNQSPDGRLGLNGQHRPVADPASNGEPALRAARFSGDASLEQAAMEMLDFLLTRAPRTKGGAIYHNLEENRIWVDSIYMLPPFLAVAGHPEEAIRQITEYRTILRDPNTGLYHHIWDEDRQDWGREAFWGVGNGWAAAGMARVIAALPDSMAEERERLEGFVRELLDACLEYQRTDGLFHDVLDDPDSFVETNTAQMLAYTIYRGVAAGWLDKAYLVPANRMRLAAHQKVDALGLVHDVCGAPNFDRPGTAAEGQAFFILMEAAWRDLGQEKSTGDRFDEPGIKQR